MLTRKQAHYHARRAYRAEYARALSDPSGPGRNSDRQDSCQTSAELAYEYKLAEHGYQYDYDFDADDLATALNEVPYYMR